jgi:LytR cell envelope-related transcriptional attenuator
VSSGAIRGAIVVAAVVVGAVVLANGFPSSGSPSPRVVTSPPTTPTASASGTGSPSPDSTKTQGGGGPSPQGPGHVLLAIYNTTSVPGLAACAADDLTRQGYTIPDGDKFLGNAPASAVTILFYRDTQGKADAGLLNRKYFDQTAEVRKLGGNADVPKSADIAIYLGADYANTHQGNC